MLKSLISLILVIALCFSLPAVLPQASAEATYTYGNLVYSRINDSYCKIVGCLPNVGGSLFIPEKLGILTVAEISEGAFASMPIKTLAIDGKVVNGQGLVIRKGAFKNCPIEVLTVYDGVEKIYKEAFSGCPIERMYLPKSLKLIEQNAFSPLSDNRKTEINFRGTKNEWSAVSVVSPNGIFTNADWKYSVSTGHEYNSPEATLLYTDGLYEPVTVNATDSADIAGYYIGTDDTYYENEFITTRLDSVTWDIEFPNTYYFTVADINGNVSQTLTAKIIGYSLDGNEVSDMFGRYLIKAETEISPAAPEINTSDVFKGWSENPDASEGKMSFIPEDGKTYYAIWERVSPEDREVVLSHETEDGTLALTVSLKEAKGLTSGELTLDYDKSALVFRECERAHKYYSFSCYEYEGEFRIDFSTLTDEGILSDDSELCTLYFDIIKKDGSATALTVSGRYSLADIKNDTEYVTLPLVPREFTLKAAVSEDKLYLNLYLEKGENFTDGTLALGIASDVFTLTEVRCATGSWSVGFAEPADNAVSILLERIDGVKLTNEKYDVCTFVFTVNDRNAGEKTITVAGTGTLSTAKGDSVTVNLQYIPEEPEFTLGDVDNDGSITAADARLALRASVGLENLSEAQQLAADTDSDSQISASDARTILRASVGLEQLS